MAVTYTYPSLPSQPTRAHFTRLLWRAGFSGSPAQVDPYQALGLKGAIERLLTPATSGVLVGEAPRHSDGTPLDPINIWGDNQLWWLDRMVRSRNQLQERMTLNLHDHLATSIRGVGNPRHMLRQNSLLRRHAMGSFADLMLEITYDPAMLLWLNGGESNRRAPNENYGRELMELFCLGLDPDLETLTHGLWRRSHVYSQADVHAAARALTGWRYDWKLIQSGTLVQQENPVRYDPTWHDTGLKTIFGRRGRWNYRDVVSLVLHHPNHAPFLAWKLWSYFVPTPPPADAMRMMVANYRASGFQLKPLLRVILRHPDFYADLDNPRLVKPPIVYLAGALRMTGQTITSSWAGLCDQMGQMLFSPPSVAGWPQNEAWLDSNTVRARWTTMNHVLADPPPPGEQTPAEVVDTALELLGHPWISTATRARLEAYAQTYFDNHKTLVPPRTGTYQLAADRDRLERLKAVMGLIMAGPDGQLH
ncbi:MAG: DUF1800 domain-containing protein [Gaiellales bacterium]